MRLSSKKAAYVVVDESSVVGNPEFARDDKGGVGASRGNWLVAERITGVADLVFSECSRGPIEKS